MTLRIGLIGAGRIGQVHARAVAASEKAELAAVHDPIDSNAEKVMASTGSARREIDGIFSDQSIGAVLICSPTDMHAAQCEAAAAAGKAIFCEKPIDLDLVRAEACVAKAASSGVQAMLGFNRRFDPHFLDLKRQLDDGKIGRPELVQITSRDPSPPPIDYVKRSGGLFRDMMIHDLDMAQFLLGEPLSVVGVTADSLVDADIAAVGDVDTAAVTLRAASGTIVVITNSRRATYGYDQRIEVHGALGCLSAGNPAVNQTTLLTGAGALSPPLMDFFMDRYAAAYAAQIDAFIKLCLDHPVDVPGLVDGLSALRLATECSELAGLG
ncbi:MAG: inositol 2-dehydrogenase [Pseudomonadota bacterium]